MKKWIVLILLGGFLLPSISPAIDLKQSKFTQVVNNVEVISSTDKTRHGATVNDVFKMPDVLRTGPDSRAELVAPDNTITRVGANTIFSFDPANRTIDLQQGSILFHSPHGKGGGTIRTGSATASVIGTTIIVTSTPGGGFKLLDLEGQAEIRFLNGLHRTLEPGQMTFILPGGSASPIVVFRLDSQTKGSLLVNGFDAPLPSIGKIEAEITRQLLQLLNNQAQDSGLLVGNNATPDSVQVRMDLLDETPPSRPSGFQGDSSVIGSDHVSGLPVNYSPLDPTHVANNSFTPPNIDSINQGLDFLGITTPASGFVGNNIDIDTANVDLSSFAGKSDFEFMASGDIKIWQSVNFTPVIDEPLEGPPPIIIAPDTISLIAGGQMLIASGSTLEADTGTFGLVADSFGTLDTESGTVGEANTLDDVTVINHVGDVDILSLQDLNVFNSTFTAGGDIDIESQNGNLNLGEEDDVIVDAGGSVSLSAGQDFTFVGGDDGYIDAENGGVDILAGNDATIDDAEITANGGDLNIIAGGSISISDGDLEAHNSDSVSGDDESSGGNVTISGTGSVQIENNTYIYGDGNVDISSSGTISVDTEGSSSGTIDIEDSQIEAGGCVSVTADGTVYFSGDEITADSGRITVSGGGDVSIFSSTIDANGSVDITSGGTLTVGNEDSVTALDDGYDVSISAGGNARLSASGGGDVDVTDTSITAGGNVCITTEGTISLGGDDTEEIGGNIDLEDSSVTAGNSINVNANDGNVTINGTTLTAGGDYQNIEPADLVITPETPVPSIFGSDGGNITISATENADISDSTLDIKGDISFSDDTIVAGEGGITISGGDGSVSISGNDVSLDDTEILGNKVCISDTDISATDGNVNITDGGSITISGRIVSVDDDSDISANNITIKSGSDISASTGDVNITDNGSLTISGDCSAEISGSTIDVNNIKICDSTITADDGNINITDNGTASIPSSEDSDSITVDTISISGSEVAASGNVTISANGNVTINDSPISATAGNEITAPVEISSDKVSISSGGELSITGTDSAGTSDNGFGYDIGADSKICLFGANGVSINDAVITTLNGDLSDMVKISSGGDIGIDSSDITSGGNVCLTADGSILINQPNILEATTITAGGVVNLHAGGDVDTYETSISANGGDVNICAGGDVDLEYTDVSADGAVNVNADGNVTVHNDNLCMNDWNVNAGGFVDLNADGYTDVKNSDISASGDIDIESGSGSIDLGCSTFSSDDVSSGSIEDCSVTISGDGGSITVGNSDNNNITINHSTFNSGGVTISSGSVITSDNGDVNITGNGGAITIGEGDNNNITVNCSTFISGGVTISDSQITANNGDVIITGNGGSVSIGDGDNNTVSESGDTFEIGNVDISGSTIVANNGNVDISGSGDVTINDSPISASAGVEPVGDSESSGDKVIISSGGELSITGTDSAGVSDNEFGYDIGADRKICLFGANGVSINDALIETLDGSSCDEIKISSDGDISVDGSEIDSSGKVKIAVYDGGSVNVVDGSSISACGDVCITSEGTVALTGDSTISEGGDIDIECSTISAGNDVDVEAGGTLTINAGHDFETLTEDGGGCYDISAGDTVTLDGACVKIKDTAIFGGDGISVTGTDGNVKLTDVDMVTCEGDVDITADSGCLTLAEGCADYGVVIDAGGSVNLTADNNIHISDSEITAEDGDVSITSNDGGNICISGGSDISASGDVCITSDGTVALTSNDSISEGGSIDLECSSVTAEGSVFVSASGDVTINDSQINFGKCNDLTISDNQASQNGDIYAVSQNGDVDISAGGGQVVVCSGGEISLVDSQFHPEGNLSISDSSINTINGTIAITTGGEIDLYGDDSVSISGVEVVGGSISISDSTIHAITSGDINIGGDGQIFFNGSLQYCGYTAVAGDISISDSDITADDGDVNINSGGTVTIQGDAGDWIISGNNVNVTADCAVDLDAADISARAGDLNISAGGVLNIADDCVNGNSTLSGDNVTLTGGEGVSLDWNFGSATITANNGNVLIESGNGDVLIGGVSITASGCANIYADYGNVDLESTTVTTTGGNVDIEAGRSDLGGSETLTLNNDTITAGGSVTLSAQGNGNLNQDEGGITISGTSINANTTSGMICVNNASGVTTIDNGSSMQAFYINVNSPDGILLDGSGGSISANTMCLKASLGDASDDATGAHSITVQNANLADIATQNIRAHTVNLNNDKFSGSGSYNYTSFYGGYHINDGNVGGYVNFNNDTLDGSAITSSDAAGTVNPNNNGGIVLGGSGAGIHIH